MRRRGRVSGRSADEGAEEGAEEGEEEGAVEGIEESGPGGGVCHGNAGKAPARICVVGPCCSKPGQVVFPPFLRAGVVGENGLQQTSSHPLAGSDGKL